MYVYVCMYVYIHVCMYVYIYVCMYTYMYVYMYTYMYVYMYVCIHVCMYTYIYIYTLPYVLQTPAAIRPQTARIPSPKDLIAHTQAIMQNALIKKQLEDQKERFLKKQQERYYLLQNIFL